MPISVSLNLWKPWIRNVITEFNRMYPLLSWGTYGGHEPTQDRATDGMVPGWQNAAGNAIGWAVARFLWANRKKYNIWYIIFDRKIISETRPAAGWIRYFAADDPNPSKNHRNHVHVSFYANDPGGVITAPVLKDWDGKSFPGAQYFYIGAQGPHVTWLGQRLVAHGWTGYMVGPGAEFHPNDQKGVKWFQEKQGWTGSDADGIPGPLTWSLLAADPVVVPPATVPPVKPPAPVLPTYKVKAGDTLSSIAARIGTNWQTVAALNTGANPDRLKVGQVLTVPKAVPAPKPEPEPEPTVNARISVVTANVFRRTEKPRAGGTWTRRKSGVVAAIKSGKPDLVLGMELDQVTAADVAAGLGEGWAYDRSKGIGIFWRQAVLERTGEGVPVLYPDNDNRYLFYIPFRHKASGIEFRAAVTHLENDGGGTGDHGHRARHVEMKEFVKRTDGSGRWIFGADLNSTTRSNGGTDTRGKQKPRPMLKAAGWWLLSDQSGVTNRAKESHHGGQRGYSDNAPWIDDSGAKGGVDYVSGKLILTDSTDVSDHNFLQMTVNL